ncbi:MAG TPA: hypothetical protein V6D28_27905 [Leptolyngbyaceae cyanobacterium]
MQKTLEQQGVGIHRMTFDIWTRDGTLMIAIDLKPANWSDCNWAVKTTAATPLLEKIIAWVCGGWHSVCGYNYAYFFYTKEQAEHFCFLMNAYSSATSNPVEEIPF